MDNREYLLSVDELRAQRRECGWSQEEVARRLGVSRSTVNGWEGGFAVISEKWARAYAALFEGADR